MQGTIRPAMDDPLQRAHALLQGGDPQAAEAICRRLLRQGSSDVGLYGILAVICWQSDRHAEMEQLLRRSLQLDPNHGESHYNLGLVLAHRGAEDEAIDHYRRALPRADPHLEGSIHWNLSKLLLRRGDYAEGWRHYEWRRHKPQPLPPICRPAMEVWDGRSSVAGELILVGEQGLGDMIQFLRYAPSMANAVGQVALCLPASLQGLVRAAGLAIPLRSPAEVEAGGQGRWWPLLSVPGHLGVTPERVVVGAPYLRVPWDRVASWRQRLRQGLDPSEMLLGLHWQGNPATETSELRGRSLPLRALEPLAQLPHLRLVSLQKGAGGEQLLTSVLRPLLVEAQPQVEDCWDFLETAAMALACDLLITSDSALAHLAGAIGAPTWLLLHGRSDWRWGRDGERTFWYPSLRLFRQRPGNAGDWREVIESVLAALASEPPRQGSAAREGQALQWLQRNQPQRAEALYRQLLTEGRATNASRINLAVICGASGRSEEAERLLNQALGQDPDNASALANLGLLHVQRQEWTTAETRMQQALARDPQQLVALQGLSALALQGGRHDEAIAHAHAALAVACDSADGHHNLGVALRAAGRLREARDSYERALQRQPDHAEAAANLSMILLLQGDYTRGLALREARFRKKQPVRPIARSPLPRWDPAGPPARRLQVIGEQGLGDMLQFLRYVPLLERQGLAIDLCLPGALLELARASGIGSRLMTPEQLEGRQEPADAWVPLLSLPWHLGVTPERVLAAAPYLRSTPERRRHWQQRIRASAAGRPVLGLHWQGNRETGNLVGRSLPLETLAPIAAAGPALLSLQRGHGCEQLNVCSFRDRFLSCQLQLDRCWDFLDVAAMVLACDLVITSDSALAHLAGGLGVPTWLLLMHIPDWRWGLEGERSFWYPSLRLFRQRRAGDWPEVVARLSEQLHLWLMQRGNTADPGGCAPGR